MSIPRRESRIASAALRQLTLVAIVAAAAGLSAYYALLATNWVVMTDELQTAKLATSIADTFSPLPHVHGERYGSPSQLYPLLIAPFFGLLSGPSAIDAAHGLNALLLASAALPAYLLARSVTRSTAGGLFAAALTVFVPWLALSTTLLTENAAYPASVWALLLSHRTIAAPSPVRDAAALAGLFVAFLARTQLLVLAAVLPVAALVHELGRAGALSQRGSRRAAIRRAALDAVRSHRLLALVYGCGGLVALALAVVGRLGQVFGTYAEAFRGDLFPPGVWRAAVEHLDYVVVGIAVAPFLLSAAWAVGVLLRPQRREAHAFAALLLALVPMLSFQVASFNLRFTAGGFVQDRYLCYLAPPLAVGAAAALLERGHRGLRAALIAASGVLFAVLAGVAPFSPVETIFWASPASAFHPALATAGGWIGLSGGALVRLAAVALAVLLALVVWRAAGVPALVGTGLAVVAFCTFELVYVVDRVALPITTRQGSLPDVPRDWIDAAVPGDASVALVPNPVLKPDYWWDAELWNKRADRVVQTQGTTYTPFPAMQLTLDSRTGAMRGLPPTTYFVLATAESRFGFAAATTVVRAPPLVLLRVARPQAAQWATSGASPDGWTFRDRRVTLRVFAAGSPGVYDVGIELSAPPGATRAVPFTLETGGVTRKIRLAPASAARVDLSVCVRESVPGAATLLSRGAARIPDGRAVGVHIDAIETVARGRACAGD